MAGASKKLGEYEDQLKKKIDSFMANVIMATNFDEETSKTNQWENCIVRAFKTLESRWKTTAQEKLVLITIDHR